MISGYFTRRLALLAAFSSALLLAACGGDDDNGGGGGQTNLRALNLATDLASVDLYTGDTKRFSALARDTMAPSISFEANTHAVAVKRVNETATLYSDSFSLDKDRSYTAVIAGRESGLVVRMIPENENSNGIAAGNFRVRVFNLISDSGGVDVYLVPAGTTISDATLPTLRFTNNTLSDFLNFTTATSYRLLITGQGNLDDVRLDITLNNGAVDKQFHTLVLTSGLSGALVNATLIPQGGTAVSLKNAKARVRVAAGADGNGNVMATVAGTSITGTLRSPNVSPYKLVDAGDRDLTVTLNGTVLTTGTRNFAAGSDYTVLAFGSAGTPRFELLNDDNRAPILSTRAKIRLVNVAAASEPMSLRADFQSLVTDVAAGTASPYFTVSSATSARVEVTTPGAGQLFTLTSSGSQPLLQAAGVYTLFMLGGNSTPTGQLSKDR
jgi:hypothetical protein